MKEVKEKAVTVTTQASAVTYAAKDIAQAAERQVEALAKAKSMLSSVAAATEEALAALRCYFRVACFEKCNQGVLVVNNCRDSHRRTLLLRPQIVVLVSAGLLFIETNDVAYFCKSVPL